MRHRREWIAEDFVGRQWRLSIVWNKDEPGGAGESVGRDVVESLIYFGVQQEYVREPRTIATLLEIYDELTGRHVSEGIATFGEFDLRSLHVTRDELRDTLKHAVGFGHLRIEPGRNWMRPTHEPPPDTLKTPDAPPFVPPEAPFEELDWVGILLRDDAGHPIANARCIVTPDGAAPIAGFTGPDGRVRIGGIASGACSIELPDFDASEWGPQSEAI